MPDAPRQRLRFESLDHEVFKDGRCRVTVRLEWRGRVFEGVAEGTQPLLGALRTAARATLEAASQAVGRRIELSLAGVKTVRAFDGTVVVAAVRGQADDRDYRLLGVMAEGDAEATETCARAVLSALNRVLELYFRGASPPTSVPDG